MFESMEDQGMFAMHGDGLDFRNAHRYQEWQVKTLTKFTSRFTSR